MQSLEQIEQQLQTALENKDIKTIRQIVSETQFVDFAEAMTSFDSKNVLKIFRLLEINSAAEIFTYLDSDHQEFIIQAFTGAEIREILDELYTDDIIDLIDEMPSEVVKKILKSTTKDVRKEINDILKYQEYTAGAIMSINFTELQAEMTVEMALKAIQRRHAEYDEIDDLFIINTNNKLCGWLELKELIINPPTTMLKDVMNTKILSVHVDMAQEEVANYFKRYDINTLPVVNKNDELLGIITVDDVIDVLVEESNEDIQNFAGIDADDVENEYFATPIWNLYKSRIVSLMGILLLGILTHVIILVLINQTELVIYQDHPIVLMIPILLVMLGICTTITTQTSLMTIRSLALNQIQKKDIGRILAKETLVATLISFTLIVLNVVRLLLIYGIDFQVISHTSWLVIGYSSLAIFIAILLANCLGFFLPLLFKTMKWDPSVASTPVIITIVDILCCLLFMGLSLLV